MRCPHCQADVERGQRDCPDCRGRLYAWLGDPFGSSDAVPFRPGSGGPPAAAPAAAGSSSLSTASVAAPPAASAGFPWGKVIIAALLALLLTNVWPWWGLFTALALGLTLWTKPNLGWRWFVALLPVSIILGAMGSVVVYDFFS